MKKFIWARPPAQCHPGPTLMQPLLLEEYSCEDEYGTKYVPWVDGWATGFKIIPPDGVVQWVYLNPSSSDEGAEQQQSTVFVYHDEDEGDGPHYFEPLMFIATYDVPRGNS